MTARAQETLLIENLLSSPDVFTRCIEIVKPEYFDIPEYRPVVKFIAEYFSKYNNAPSTTVVNAETGQQFATRQITAAESKYTCDAVEKHCKQAAFVNALRDGIDLVGSHDIDKAFKLMSDAMKVSLDRDMGISFFDLTEEQLQKFFDEEELIPTGIGAIDRIFGGGFIRGTLTLCSANSGVGKSNTLMNFGINYSCIGLHVLYLSLELSERLLTHRAAAMSSRINIALLKNRVPDIVRHLIRQKNNGVGSLRIKRVPNGMTANYLRSYLKHYETEYQIIPDVIIVDYLDLMHPNGGTKNKNISEQDKEKSEEFTEVLFDYNAIGISASQQNREALRLGAPDQGVIAGGITKVNTVHNYFSLSSTDQQRLRGEIFLHCLKARTSNGTGKTAELHIDENTLVISDPRDANNNPVVKFVERASVARNHKQLQSSNHQKVQEIISSLNKPTVNSPSEVVQAPWHDMVSDEVGLAPNETMDCSTGEIMVAESRPQEFVKTQHDDADLDPLLELMNEL
jgi:replicative DNA helicase